MFHFIQCSVPFNLTTIPCAIQHSKLINNYDSLVHLGDLGREVEELVTVITEQEIEADEEDDDDDERSESSRKDHEITITRV